jgi:hypothetical protein
LSGWPLLSNGAWVVAEWEDGDEDFDYYGYSGTVTASGSETRFSLTFDGEMYDYNDPILTRTDGTCSWPYNTVAVSGKISMNATFISEEVWNAWD